MNDAAANKISDWSFKIKFICWHCRPEVYTRNGIFLDIFESACSLSQSNCGQVLKNTVEANLIDYGAHYYKYGRMGGTGIKYNPFERESGPEILVAAVLGFVSGKNGSGAGDHTDHPSLWETTRETLRSGFSPTSFHPVGKTPTVKLITAEGVVDAKSSPDVYFAPFTTKVWLAILV